MSDKSKNKESVLNYARKITEVKKPTNKNILVKPGPSCKDGDSK